MKARLRQFVARIFERQVARLVARHHLMVVAVAGSVGKTSTRAAIATVLRHKYVIQSISHPGYNSEIGLPLSVFDFPAPKWLLNPFAWIWLWARSERIIRGSYRPEVLVLELGTDHPGEMARFVRYLTPDIAVITAITPEHMENFAGLDAVAAEELLLASAAKHLVVNIDELPTSYRRTYVDPHPRHYSYGLATSADYRAKIRSADPISGSTVEFAKHKSAVLEDLHLSVYGTPAVKAALAGYAVADLLHCTKLQVQKGLARIRPVHGRMQVMPGINGSTLIDDTYNSSPAAAVAALEALTRMQPIGRRIAVLGSMNELGEHSPAYHAEVGAAAAGVDMLVTIGDLASDYLAPAAIGAGLDPTAVKTADSPYAAGEFLRLLIAPGDLILFKGSQNGVFAEEAVKLLLRDAKDASKLVRQSPSWLRTKQAQFNDFVG